MIEAAPESYVGQQFGDYTVTGVLAIGGMGRVLRATRQTDQREVAIKVLAGGFLEDAEAVERFKREAHLIEQIPHPGLVKIHEHAFTPEGLPYLVMELLEGEPLNFRLERLGKMPEPMAISVARQLAATLAAVHAAGVVHRDLKPGNIFLVPGPLGGDDVVKLFDFGIAKAFTLGGLTRTGTVMGTPVYLAPEQCLDAKHVDHRADIYAFGVILYEMLSGEPPFTGGPSGGLREILRQQLNDPPPRLQVNRHLSDIVMRCLRKGPDHRYPSMDEVLAALDELPRKSAATRIELDPTVKQKLLSRTGGEGGGDGAATGASDGAGAGTGTDAPAALRPEALRMAPTEILARPGDHPLVVAAKIAARVETDGARGQGQGRARSGGARVVRWLLFLSLLGGAAAAGVHQRHRLAPVVNRVRPLMERLRARLRGTPQVARERGAAAGGSLEDHARVSPPPPAPAAPAPDR
jgi:tRNA A-37 threonylcarbamoyl transferase component Bud32